MTKKKEQASTLSQTAFEQAVEMLCHQILDAHQGNPDPSMAIIVDLTTTDTAAIKLGWPSAKLMKKAVEEAIRILPNKVTDRIELEEVR